MNSSFVVSIANIKRVFALLVILAATSFSGCYQRTIAPEVTYDQSTVDALDDQLKKFEWE